MSAPHPTSSIQPSATCFDHAAMRLAGAGRFAVVRQTTHTDTTYFDIKQCIVIFLIFSPPSTSSRPGQSNKNSLFGALKPPSNVSLIESHEFTIFENSIGWINDQKRKEHSVDEERERLKRKS
jgi:hypothetical protein